MAALNKGKHIVDVIDGVRCTVVESGITEDRADFLKAILQHNGLEVKIGPAKKVSEEEVSKFVLGVTDIVFNPVIAIYERKLRSMDGKHVSPAFWNQQTTHIDNKYWRFRKPI